MFLLCVSFLLYTVQEKIIESVDGQVFPVETKKILKKNWKWGSGNVLSNFVSNCSSQTNFSSKVFIELKEMFLQK